MSTIRPPGFSPASPTTAPQRANAARLEAQKAFFQMATGQAPAAPAAFPAQPSPAAPSRPQRVPERGAEAPARILRPGSLLDIRV